jgi:hypothetical protein
LFLTDKRIQADSNTVERCIRSIRSGRRNALFADSVGSGTVGTPPYGTLVLIPEQVRFGAEYAFDLSLAEF